MYGGVIFDGSRADVGLSLRTGGTDWLIVSDLCSMVACYCCLQVYFTTTTTFTLRSEIISALKAIVAGVNGG